MKIKSAIVPSPALIETYCRLLSTPEVESPAVKNLLATLLPAISKNNAWIYLHMILEMFSYRLSHIAVGFVKLWNYFVESLKWFVEKQSQHRVSLLNRLQAGLLTGPHNTTIKHPQLNASMEFTTLRLLLGKNIALRQVIIIKGTIFAVEKLIQINIGQTKQKKN